MTEAAHVVSSTHQPCLGPEEMSDRGSILAGRRSWQMCQRAWDRRKDGGEETVAMIERKSLREEKGKRSGSLVEASGVVAKWRGL